MGRFYNGDIEGKFWFGIQSSDDASFFGGIEREPNYLEYYFDKDDLPQVKKGLKQCKAQLGEDLKKLDAFFKKHNAYRDEMIAEETGIEDVRDKLEWYARYRLGNKIKKRLEEAGYCEFQAEL